MVIERECAKNGAVIAQVQVTRKVVIFRLAEQTYGIPLDAVREILPLSSLSQPPGLPQMLAGFLNLGGVAVPVVNLARLFGLKERREELYTPLLIMRSPSSPLALLVDAVEQIVSVEEPVTVPIRNSFCFNDCADNLLSIDDVNVVLLSYERLLCEQERCRLGELAALEQVRIAGMHEVS